MITRRGLAAFLAAPLAWLLPDRSEASQASTEPRILELIVPEEPPPELPVCVFGSDGFDLHFKFPHSRCSVHGDHPTFTYTYGGLTDHVRSVDICPTCLLELLINHPDVATRQHPQD